MAAQASASSGSSLWSSSRKPVSPIATVSALFRACAVPIPRRRKAARRAMRSLGTGRSIPVPSAGRPQDRKFRAAPRTSTTPDTLSGVVWGRRWRVGWSRPRENVFGPGLGVLFLLLLGHVARDLVAQLLQELDLQLGVGQAVLAHEADEERCRRPSGRGARCGARPRRCATPSSSLSIQPTVWEKFSSRAKSNFRNRGTFELATPSGREHSPSSPSPHGRPR